MATAIPMSPPLGCTPGAGKCSMSWIPVLRRWVYPIVEPWFSQSFLFLNINKKWVVENYLKSSSIKDQLTFFENMPMLVIYYSENQPNYQSIKPSWLFPPVYQPSIHARPSRCPRCWCSAWRAGNATCSRCGEVFGGKNRVFWPVEWVWILENPISEWWKSF